jgi:beta-glucanase (GH16 family)
MGFLARFCKKITRRRNAVDLVSSRPFLWNDEFDGTEIDSSKWSFEIGTGTNGWGNNELQYYTDRRENAYVKDGMLHIRAQKEPFNGSDYTSARLVSKNKFSFTYGTVEARIALPVGKGIWPAFWMLGDDIDTVAWPACGEIDIVEAVNTENVVYGTNHWFTNGHAIYGNNTTDFHGASFQLDVTKFHVYKLEWDEERISMHVDGFKYHEMSIENNVGGTNAFHRPFYIVLNVAVGGDMTKAGRDIDDSQFPNEMLVDYIRVFPNKRNDEK